MESIPEIALEAARQAYYNCDDRIRKYLDKLFGDVIEKAKRRAVKAAEEAYFQAFVFEERRCNLYGNAYKKKEEKELEQEARLRAERTAKSVTSEYIKEKERYIAGALAEDEFWASDEGKALLHWKTEREAGAAEALPTILTDDERINLFLDYYDHPTMAHRCGSLITRIWDEIHDQYPGQRYEEILMRNDRFAKHKTRFPPQYTQGDPIIDHSCYHSMLGIGNHTDNRLFTLDEWTAEI